MNDLLALIEQRRIIVCCGSGGVGKTTTAAAIAVGGARRGRRTCVVTIDPARRLADALGVDSLTNIPGRVEGPWPGELWAVMLDTRSTFDDAVTRYARDQAQARAILDSRLYRNLCETLSGTQEYMAVEKLYQLQEEGDFDLIVVDTPPSRRAVDFLDAPGHLTRLLDNPVFQTLAMPSRVYLRAVAVAAVVPLKAAAKIVGAETVLDTVAFLRAFEGMQVGIRSRAGRVLDLFAQPSTAFVVVVAARQDAIDEGQFFAARLGQSDIPVRALIVNRLHPRFDAQSAAATLAVAQGARSGHTPNRANAQAFTDLDNNWAELRAVAEREDKVVAGLTAQVAPAPVARVPLLDGDVHDLDGVEAVADHLFGLGDGHRSASSTVKVPTIEGR